VRKICWTAAAVLALAAGGAFSARVAAALRNEFGGHPVKVVESAKAGQDPR
jgi:hypothetical protein